MGVNTKVTSFQYTAASTSNIVLTGFGFQPKAIITHWVGIASATDSTAAGHILQGWGFADGTRQNCASRSTENGVGTSAGSTYGRADAVVVCTTPGVTTLDGYISFSTFDSDGVTFTVPDAISVNLTVMVIAIGGTDITNVYTGIETDAAATGNKSNTAVGFQSDIILFAGMIDANTAYPGGANSEDGIAFGVAKASGAGNQYVSAVVEDDASLVTDTGSYIFDNEFLVGQSASTPATIVARKQFVSMDATGFTFNQLELPQTTGGVTQFHYLAIKGGNWYVGDLLTQTDTSTTVTETGMAASPALIIMSSVSKAKSTQDVGTAGLQMSFGAATSTTERMAMAVQDENALEVSETSRGVEYDSIYANISTADAIQGLGDISAINSDGFTFVMDDADPAQYFAWWIALAPSAVTSTGTLSKTLGGLTRSIAGTVLVSGTTSKTLGSLTKSISGTVSVSGSLDKNLGALTKTLSGNILVQGTLSKTLGGATLSASGTVVDVVSTGTLNKTLGILLSTASANAIVSGTTSKTLGVLGSTISGTILVTGTTDKTLGSITKTIDGTVLVNGNLSKTLGELTKTLSGNVIVSGVTSKTLGALTLVSTTTNLVLGTTNKTLDVLNKAITGNVLVQATTTKTLGDLTKNISANILVQGTTDKTLGTITLSSSGSIGTVVTIASLDKSLGYMSPTISGNVLDSGVLNKTLGLLTSSIVGNIIVDGDLSSALGSLGITSSGTVFYPAMNQEGFLFRYDDGSESTATWMQPQDTDAKTSLQVPFRLRVLVDSDSSTDSDFQIEYRKLLSASPVLWGEWKKV